MALSLKHKFQTTKSDGSDTSLLRPSNWNDDHAITLVAGNIIGRPAAAAGSGDASEIPLTAIAQSILAAGDAAAILAILGAASFTTGDVKLTLKAAADTGWVMFDDGTIGNVGSGASTLASAAAQALFTLLFNAPFTDATAPIFTSSGVATTRAAQASAANAWSTNLCRLSLNKTLGRALAIAGSGSGLSARTLGQILGAEQHQLLPAELPTTQLTFTGTLTGLSVTTSALITSFNAALSAGSTPVYIGGTTGLTSTGPYTPAGAISSFGANGLHNNMQPTTFLNAMVKL